MNKHIMNGGGICVQLFIAVFIYFIFFTVGNSLNKYTNEFFLKEVASTMTNKMNIECLK